MYNVCTCLIVNREYTCNQRIRVFVLCLIIIRYSYAACYSRENSGPNASSREYKLTLSGRASLLTANVIHNVTTETIIEFKKYRFYFTKSFILVRLIYFCLHQLLIWFLSIILDIFIKLTYTIKRIKGMYDDML